MFTRCTSGSMVLSYVPKWIGFSRPLESLMARISWKKGPRGSSSLLWLGDQASDSWCLRSRRGDELLGRLLGGTSPVRRLGFSLFFFVARDDGLCRGETQLCFFATSFWGSPQYWRCSCGRGEGLWNLLRLSQVGDLEGCVFSNTPILLFCWRIRVVVLLMASKRAARIESCCDDSGVLSWMLLDLSASASWRDRSRTPFGEGDAVSLSLLWGFVSLIKGFTKPTSILRSRNKMAKQTLWSSLRLAIRWLMKFTFGLHSWGGRKTEVASEFP